MQNVAVGTGFISTHVTKKADSRATKLSTSDIYSWVSDFVSSEWHHYFKNSSLYGQKHESQKMKGSVYTEDNRTLLTQTFQKLTLLHATVAKLKFSYTFTLGKEGKQKANLFAL